jgi:hypothetical protein
MRIIEIIGIEGGIEKEGTILHVTKSEDEEKWFVFDECIEGVQADGTKEFSGIVQSVTI